MLDCSAVRHFARADASKVPHMERAIKSEHSWRIGCTAFGQTTYAFFLYDFGGAEI